MDENLEEPNIMRIVHDPEVSRRKERRHDRVLKTVAVLPSLATLGNLLCGLGAIYVCMLSMQAGGAGRHFTPIDGARLSNFFPSFLAIAAYLLFASMFFDAIDGRLARMTRKTSEFGAQLDSLADVVSFGVAPAVLVLCIAYPGDVTALSGPARAYWRAEWVMAAVFVSCAALRLARFNVESVADESAHMGFRGLPTPGAAGAVISLVILHQDLLVGTMSDWTYRLIGRMMPPFAMVLGLLMVSRFGYPHVVNAILRGRRPFRQIVGMVIILLIGLVVQFQLTIAIAAILYALSGPVGAAVRKMRGITPGAPAQGETSTPETTGEPSRQSI